MAEEQWPVEGTLRFKERQDQLEDVKAASKRAIKGRAMNAGISAAKPPSWAARM